MAARGTSRRVPILTLVKEPIGFFSFQEIALRDIGAKVALKSLTRRMVCLDNLAHLDITASQVGQLHSLIQNWDLPFFFFFSEHNFQKLPAGQIGCELI